MQNIIITGASTGIGLESAKYLKEQGLRVYPTARRDEDVEMLKSLGFDGAMKLDVCVYEDIDRAISTVLQKDGVIDVWFNNAGYGQAGAIEDLDTKYLKEQFESNVFGLYEAMRRLIPVMRKQGYGKIINHSSVLGLISLEGRGAYNASKYAIEGLSDTLRLELMGSGVYVSVLNTGPVTSEFRNTAMRKLQENVDIQNSLFKDKYLANIKSDKSSVPFNLPAIEVAKVVYKITQSKKPKPRYYITKATYILGFLKRILPTSWLDKILYKIS
jgi:short-subunit dehydrogenase